jgi:hypothetical protein
MLKNRTAFEDIGAAEYDQRQRERELKALRRKAAQFGLELTPKPTTEPAPG